MTVGRSDGHSLASLASPINLAHVTTTYLKTKSTASATGPLRTLTRALYITLLKNSVRAHPASASAPTRSLGNVTRSQRLVCALAAVTCMTPLASCPCLVPPRVASWVAAWAHNPCVVDAAAANTLLATAPEDARLDPVSSLPRRPTGKRYVLCCQTWRDLEFLARESLRMPLSRYPWPIRALAQALAPRAALVFIPFR